MMSNSSNKCYKLISAHLSVYATSEQILLHHLVSLLFFLLFSSFDFGFAAQQTNTESQLSLKIVIIIIKIIEPSVNNNVSDLLQSATYLSNSKYE